MSDSSLERQFRLSSVAILALAALACLQEPKSREGRAEIQKALVIENAQLVAPSPDIEVEGVKEVEAMNRERTSKTFAFGKAGY